MPWDDLNPSIPLFFLSYAHANGPQPDPNDYFSQFFNELSRNVAELVPRMHGGEPGFMDRTMRGGGRWTDELLQAVGGCQVFVPLLSALYMRSEWCAMEWHAFSQRTVDKVKEGASSHQTCIIPVNWAPVADEDIPACVLAVQRFSPTDLPKPYMAHRYDIDGIYGLLKMGLADAYQTVAWRLALRIRDICHMHSVAPHTFDRAELHNIFQQQRDAQRLPGARQ